MKTVKELGEEARHAMNDVDDAVCLFYDEVYTDAEVMTMMLTVLHKARLARNAFFKAAPDESIPKL